MDPTLSDKLAELNATQKVIIANQDNQQKILEKHTDLLENQSQILLRNTITVETHEKRSTLLEKHVSYLETQVSKIQVIWRTIVWICGSLVAVATAIAGVYEILRK